jgi:acetyl-CoA C-acetyltransferase
MREAVIVSTARTPIGKAYRGAFNDTQAQALGGHVIAEAVKRARVEPREVTTSSWGRRRSRARPASTRRGNARSAPGSPTASPA